MDWFYDAPRGKVKTTWTVKTEALVPGSAEVALQGWLGAPPARASYAMKLDGPEYLTPRGVMKSSLGNCFEFVYDFDGFLPNLPAPAALGLPHDFDPKRLAQLLDRRARNPKYGDDSYWGGKDLLHFAQYLQMARELKDPSYAKLRAASHQSLTDWLTYTPGEKAHYFTRYENWRGLIGIKDSYDSARFNDHHFHYGYLIHSAALLAMEDPAFLQDYGEMLRLVAKQYANWDRQDQRFPFLRTFDVWAGHSWAGGLGSPGGNNQESSSEAMQSWVGLYLLGTLLDDPDMTAAGAMGYAVESRATMEYWFNVHGDILPVEYRHPIVGVLWSGGQVFGTYFSGDPAWVYAIQCLPQSPGLDYLVRDPDFAQAVSEHPHPPQDQGRQRRTGPHGRPRQRPARPGVAGRSRMGRAAVGSAVGREEQHRQPTPRCSQDVLPGTRLPQAWPPPVGRAVERADQRRVLRPANCHHLVCRVQYPELPGHRGSGQGRRGARHVCCAGSAVDSCDEAATYRQASWLGRELPR